MFLILAGLVVFCVVWIVRSMAKRQEGSVQEVYRGWLPWILILPALLLIGLWGYYPLVRGLVMAFQDYRITGNSPFVGLDNFIILALDGSFWASMASSSRSSTPLPSASTRSKRALQCECGDRTSPS